MIAIHLNTFTYHNYRHSASQFVIEQAAACIAPRDQARQAVLTADVYAKFGNFWMRKQPCKS